MFKKLNTAGYLTFAKENNVSTLVAKYLIGYNKTPKINQEIHSPSNFNNIDKIINLINLHINKKSKIIIYGDYDCDGVMSTSILKIMFDKLGVNVDYFIPDRYLDGYGFNEENIKKISKSHDLLICVDWGINDLSKLENYQEKGLDVIVIDHHTYSNNNKISTSIPYLHPIYSNFVTYNMSAGATCFYLATSILNNIDKYLLTLAGISILSDVMPLIEQNFIIAKSAIKYLNEYKYKNLVSLNESSTFDTYSISFKIVPKINSPGRICNKREINTLVKFFSIDEEKSNIEILNFINNTNNKRKQLTKEIISNFRNLEIKNNVIFKIVDSSLDGLNGLIAGNLMNEYKVPTFIFSQSNEDKNLLIGSIRSPKEYNVLSFLKQNEELILKYGGHQQAAGITILDSKYNNIENNANDYFSKMVAIKEPLNVIEINQEELSVDSFEELLEFSPFGEENSEPIFLLENVSGKYFRLSSSNEHTLIQLDKINMIYFNDNNFSKDDKYDLVFTLEKNNFNLNILSGKVINKYKK